MAEPEPTPTVDEAAEKPAPPGGRSKDEIALDMMRFIAVTTGYGKPSQSSAGFSGKPSSHSSEEYAQALMDLFERCRQIVAKG